MARLTQPFRTELFFLYSLHLCLVLSVVPNLSTHDNTTYEADPDPEVPANSKQIRWALAAFDYSHNLNCKQIFFTTEKECRTLVNLRREDVNIYMADPSPHGRLMALLPDGGLSRAGSHDVVLVLDPYPQANFGHFVMVFYMDLGVSRELCQREGGVYKGNGECLTLALKKRCKNALERRGRRRNFARRCEVNFLPRVYSVNSNKRNEQLLTCRSNIPGFAKCPTLRPINETKELICNPIRDNTQRCETTHETLHTSCRVFEICDQAVVISGGWNRYGTLPRHKENLNAMYHMFRRNGFKKRNIKVFFANGATGLEVKGESPHAVHPAAMKLAMRYHIQKLCSSPHCVDSMVIYMNSPSRSDGTSLLWDLDGDGLADEGERYPVDQLLEDTKDCAARQVLLLVDQSYSGEIARAVRRSKNHKNVVVFASGRDNEYSWASEFTTHWATSNHTHTCSRAIHKASKDSLHSSNPEMQEGGDVINTTIFGAPCDVFPPFTDKELRQNYLGCQNLPTALWLIKFLNNPPSRTEPSLRKPASINAGYN